MPNNTATIPTARKLSEQKANCFITTNQKRQVNQCVSYAFEKTALGLLCTLKITPYVHKVRVRLFTPPHIHKRCSMVSRDYSVLNSTVINKHRQKYENPKIASIYHQSRR